MALPSQTERSPNAGHTFVQRGTGPSRVVIVTAAALLTVGVVGGYLAFRSKGPTPPGALQQEAIQTPGVPITGSLAQSGAPGDNPGPLSRALEQGLKTGTGPNSANPTPGAGDPGKPAPVDLTAPTGTNPSAPKPVDSSPAKASNPLAPSGSTEELRNTMAAGDQKLAAGDKVTARLLYSHVLGDSRTTKSDQDSLRAKLSQINDDLLFSPKIAKGDPLAEEYVVQSGDNPTRIARKRDLATEPSLITRINKVSATGLKVGQKLKLIRGPFHAVVHKADYRLDLFAGSPDEPANWTFIRSFKVGLGTDNGTPTGNFVVKQASKLINPPWINPKTGEKFEKDDPKNPIGERWIGIEGVGASAVHTGFGLHGTVDPDSIGQQKSMGCVRMAGDDVALVYELLTEKVSLVKIEP